MLFGRLLKTTPKSQINLRKIQCAMRSMCSQALATPFSKNRNEKGTLAATLERINMVTIADLQAISGSRSRSPMLGRIAKAFNEHAQSYGVIHQNDIADCLAQISVETGGFKRLSENMNYSVSALLKMFGRHRISTADAKRFGRAKKQKANQPAIANKLYGGAWGKKNLGNIKPGDGWEFRGSGPGQATGRANFERCQKLTGIPFTTQPELMRDPDKGMQGTLALWEHWNMNKYKGGSISSRRKWNGGKHGLAKYQAAFVRAMKRRLSVPIEAIVKDVPIEVPEPDPVEEYIAGVKRVEIEEFADEIAADERVSTTKIASSVAGLGGVVATGNQVADLADQTTGLMDTLYNIGPWVLLLLVILVAWWWIHKERSKKRKRAIALRGKLV